MDPNLAWVLNLDADDELRNPVGYAPKPAVARRIDGLVKDLDGLVRPGDVVVGAETGLLAGEYVGRAWCPTPSALKRLRQSGALLPRVPDLEVLRRVNHRAFCARLGQSLADAVWVQDLDGLHAHVDARSPRPWLLKRPYGFSGRGNRMVRFPGADTASLAWIAASLKRDGLQVEPWVERERDFAIHGWIDTAGTPRLGDPTVQECDPRGGWVRSRPLGELELSRSEHDLLCATAERTARALSAAGYFGPFGIDAYRYRDDRGQSHFNPRSEINARFTMGWHVGMGSARPDYGAADPG